jgi:predicted nuclease of restriction endonuclease-like RecB superfamily
LLPQELLLVTSRDGAADFVPRYLGARDEVWIRKVAELFDGDVGRTVAERDGDLRARVRAIAEDHGISRRAADGIAHVLEHGTKTALDTALDPVKVRAVVFEEGGREDRFDREAALARAAAKLDAPVDQIVHALFADRPGRRKIVSAPTPTPAEIVERYNLALVQGFLLRSARVTVDLREHVRSVVRFAKLSGLLCTFAIGEQGSRLDLSGPLSILRHTTKYGHALARFLPAVVSTPGFRLVAEALVGRFPMRVHVGAADRLARTHALPRDCDSIVERVLARDLRRLRTSWTLARESEAIAVGTRAFFPDFTLTHADGTSVLVEIVGFYTAEYLRSKIEVLSASRRPMIVCVDESLSCAEGELPGEVLRFRRRVDARTLLARAEGLRATAEVETSGTDLAPVSRRRS